MDNSLYSQLVGILLYITHSQPDLDYVVGVVEIYMQDPHDIHWNSSKGSPIMCKEPNISGYTMQLVLHKKLLDLLIQIGLQITLIEIII